MSSKLTRVLLIITILVANSLAAREISVVFPDNIPPWTMPGDAGITVDIVKNALAFKHYQVKARYLPLKLLNQELKLQDDAHAQVESSGLTGFYSDPLMAFHTSLISLTPNSMIINNMGDLKNKRIVAFQNAAHLFGEDFYKMTQQNPDYHEVTNQEVQIAQLYKGLTDVILLDKHIFLYFRRITALANTTMPVTYHYIKGLTEISPGYVVFRDAKLRDAFNVGLKQLKTNGEYYQIYYQYVR